MSSSDEGVVRLSTRGQGNSHSNTAPGTEESSPLTELDAPESPLSSDFDNMNKDDDDAKLFGSDDSGAESGQASSRPNRTLDDEELDSGDDEGHPDRAGARIDSDNEAEYQETVNIMDLSLARAPEPLTSNGEIYTLPIPNFLSIETEEFNPETYVAPPYATAATSLCWRHDPNDESILQSNARIIRWEDGSMTLQLASAPKDQYRLSAKPLAPLNKSGMYETKLDSHVYLGAAAETSSVFRLTSHVTHGLTVMPTAMETDDAVQRLQESLAAAARGGKRATAGTAPLIEVKEDPELAKKQAVLAEREKQKAARRRQQLQDRELDRNRRAGLLRTGGAGLTVGALENDDGMLRAKPRAKRRRKANRRGEIYTDEEEEYDRRGRTREDEYDEHDGFLVGSDEELEVMEDEEDEEEELNDEDMDADGEEDEEAGAEQPSNKQRRATPERREEAEPAAAHAASPSARKKHRYVVDEEEDEEL